MVVGGGGGGGGGGGFFFFFKQKTAYEIVSRDWSSDVCSSDLDQPPANPYIFSCCRGDGQQLLRCCAHLEENASGPSKIIIIFLELGTGVE